MALALCKATSPFSTGVFRLPFTGGEVREVVSISSRVSILLTFGIVGDSSLLLNCDVLVKLGLEPGALGSLPARDADFGIN